MTPNRVEEVGTYTAGPGGLPQLALSGATAVTRRTFSAAAASGELRERDILGISIEGAAGVEIWQAVWHDNSLVFIGRETAFGELTNGEPVRVSAVHTQWGATFGWSAFLPVAAATLQIQSASTTWDADRQVWIHSAGEFSVLPSFGALIDPGSLTFGIDIFVPAGAVDAGIGSAITVSVGGGSSPTPAEWIGSVADNSWCTVMYYGEFTYAPVGALVVGGLPALTGYEFRSVRMRIDYWMET